MFDEPSSYLDVKQRLNAARTIRSLLHPTCYVICVEHDLSVLDYLSDFICCLYGLPGAYGVVTLPFSVREGVCHWSSGAMDSYHTYTTRLTIYLYYHRYQHLS
jgi:translation initiation factor RLI1